MHLLCTNYSAFLFIITVSESTGCAFVTTCPNMGLVTVAHVVGVGWHEIYTSVLYFLCFYCESLPVSLPQAQSFLLYCSIYVFRDCLTILISNQFSSI